MQHSTLTFHRVTYLHQVQYQQNDSIPRHFRPRTSCYAKLRQWKMMVMELHHFLLPFCNLGEFMFVVFNARVIILLVFGSNISTTAMK
jgi:hypothetical protein